METFEFESYAQCNGTLNTWEKYFLKYLKETLDFASQHPITITFPQCQELDPNYVFIEAAICKDLKKRNIIKEKREITRYDYFTRFPENIKTLLYYPLRGNNVKPSSFISTENLEKTSYKFPYPITVTSDKISNVPEAHLLYLKKDIDLMAQLEDLGIVAIASIVDKDTYDVDEYYYSFKLPVNKKEIIHTQRTF